MAYSELVSLSEELDKLLQILLKLLNIKKLQTKLFIKEVGEIRSVLELGITTTFMEQLVEKTLSLAIPIDDDIGLIFRTTDVKNILSIDNPWMALREVLEIVEQIDSITETQLEKFLEDTNLYDNWEEIRNNLQVINCREAVRKLLQASRELKEALNFFHDAGAETSVLSQNLHFLLTLLEDSEFLNECNGLELMKCIRNVVSKALDAVNSPHKHSLHSQMENLEIELTSQITLHSGRIEQNGIEQEANEYFKGKNGVRLVLLETLGKLHSFNVEIGLICKKIGKEEFRSWNASLRSSQHCKYSPSVSFPFGQGKKKKSNDSRRKSKQPNFR